MASLTNVFRSDGWVKTPLGPAIPGAQVYVCSQPANVAAAPPSPLASIFSDSNGTVPITQPIYTDGFGHYNFYAAAGVYTVVICVGGQIQQYYPDQSLGGVSSTSGGTGGTALTLQVNGTPNVDQLLLNFQGSGGTTVQDQGNGTVTITSSSLTINTPGQGYFWGPGLLTPPQMNLSGATGVFSGTTANVLNVYQFVLPVAVTVSRITILFSQGFGGDKASVAIYNSAKNLLLDSGAFDPSNHTTPQTNTVTPVTFPAGVYYLATASTDVSDATLGTSFLIGANSPGNNNFTRFGTAANTYNGTNMPATLGALTPFNGSSEGAVPNVFFET
jgi:hypothetical protein